MIEIEALQVENFRGIRALPLTFNRKSFGIAGPNGTGKSGIVDAIEFALTGNVTRLTGRGTSGVSLKNHGPHVDSRNHPEKAKVRLTAFVPSLNKSFTIERHVGAPLKPVITPKGDPAVEAIVAMLAEHPEFALSRREIVKYIITEAGERAKEVQALLKLDDVEKLRASLKSVTNDSKRDSQNADCDVAQARSQLLSALKVEELSQTAILSAANERRTVLGLAPLTELGKDTSLKGGVASKSPTASASPKISKAAAQSDLTNFEHLLSIEDAEAVAVSRNETAGILKQLRMNPALLRNLHRQDFLLRGLDLVDEPQCPLCDSDWDLEELKQLIQEKIRVGTEAAGLKTQLENSSRVLRRRIDEIQGLATAVQKHARGLGKDVYADTFAQWDSDLNQFRSALTSGDRLDETIMRVEGDWRRMPKALTEALGNLVKVVAALPDASVEDDAKDYLIVAQERLEVFRRAKRQLELCKTRENLAIQVASAFEESSKAILTGIYEEVEKDFSRYYALINREDEAEFRGRLTPSLGKLGFEVEFYGRGLFPPGAYHSEGHQDGMGLCLYLALMKRIMGNNFHFAVLDDVLMSVDSGHRKEVCHLLKTEFPNTQFIFTTHDQVWLNHMIGEGLVTTKSVLEFRQWSVTDGPQVWNFKDVWEEIEADLKANDVPGAAQSLRRFLEYVSADLSSRLRVPVEFRSAQSYDLGDLLPNVVGKWNKLLSQAKDAEQSWGRKDKVQELKALHDDFGDCNKATNVEKWMINPSVHYNEWMNLQEQDFRPVVNAFKAFLACFKCKNCDTFLYVSPPKGTPELLRCDCNTMSFNLKKKPA